LELALIGKTHACAALNMNRFSEDERRPCAENLIILSELDFLLLEELKLLHPDVVIFFTGPDFETRLNALLQPLHNSVADFTLRQLSKLESPLLQTRIYRTYHPGYLRQSGLEIPVLEALKREIQ
jgi:hypothetical protein